MSTRAEIVEAFARGRRAAELDREPLQLVPVLDVPWRDEQRDRTEQT